MFELPFIDACLAGKAVPEDIDKYVERWHSNPTPGTFQAFLGMHDVEYERYLTEGDSAIPTILANRVKKTEPQNVEAYVLQRPYAVHFTCPACNMEFEIPYKDFISDHGDPPDWDYEELRCPHCGQTLRVDGQDWS